jgi:hypothetical protein
MEKAAAKCIISGGGIILGTPFSFVDERSGWSITI